MPSQAVTKNRYRKAKCCTTCTHENRLYCSRHCMAVRADYVCDEHSPDAKKAPPATKCPVCAFGLNGDHSCETGCVGPRLTGCFAGKPLTRR